MTVADRDLAAFIRYAWRERALDTIADQDSVAHLRAANLENLLESTQRTP